MVPLVSRDDALSTAMRVQPQLRGKVCAATDLPSSAMATTIVVRRCEGIMVPFIYQFEYKVYTASAAGVHATVPFDR